METFLRHFPLGHTINPNPHSVCVSLPTMADVIGYEEHNPQVQAALRSGYPRFLTHHWIRLVAGIWAESAGLTDQRVLFCPGLVEAEMVCGYAGPEARVMVSNELFAVVIPSGATGCYDRARLFMQHTGVGLCSREAEQWLRARGLLQTPPVAEEIYSDDADQAIRSQLATLYHAASGDDLWLARGGMNAFYAGFRAVAGIQSRQGRNRWIQLGWLYVDTIRILEKLTDGDPVVIDAIHDLDALEQLLAGIGTEVAGIVTEVPTNPLVQTTDLPRLRELADRYGTALILDPTIASPHNVHILPYADVHINSLTKYAGNRADVMMGAVALNRASPFYAELRERLPGFISPPCLADLKRMAWQMQDYGATVASVNLATPQIVEFLQAHPNIDSVWWAEADATRKNFRQIQQKGGGAGAIISFTLRIPLERFYDPVRIVKSPSFGACFSMLCPFIYLAHYDLVTSPSGRERLARAGLSPELVRLSIGTESVEDIQQVLAEALS